MIDGDDIFRILLIALLLMNISDSSADSEYTNINTAILLMLMSASGNSFFNC